MIVAVIPCHNEESTIRDVVSRTLKYVDSVWVMDDGSTDGTFVEAVNGGARVMRFIKNHGYGYVVFNGIKSYSEEVTVTLDGDGQHEPDDIVKLIDAVKDGYDVVIGSRFLEKNSINGIKLYRKFGIWMINVAFNFGHTWITDSQSGFRAFSKEFIRSISIKEYGFGMTTELLIKARKMGFKIKEVPVSCTYHNLKQDSHLNPLQHGLDVLWKTIYWRFKVWN